MKMGSVASSPREKRNARKRSFEQCMSATAAKILKMEQEREISGGEKTQPVPVAKAPPINPVPGGGALKIVSEGGSGNHEGGSKDNIPPTQRARATAAANAVDAVLAASRPKSKLLTPKQRLGKIMGLGRSGRWKV